MNCRFDFPDIPGMECFDCVPFANGVLTDEELKEFLSCDNIQSVSFEKARELWLTLRTW